MHMNDTQQKVREAVLCKECVHISHILTVRSCAEIYLELVIEKICALDIVNHFRCDSSVLPENWL
jgi:hypothetical protein